MMRSLFSGVAGLKVHQTRMDVIGNNIANVNTTSYKSQSMVFSDLLYQTTQAASGANAETGRGGINARQIGLGAKTGAISTAITQQGSAQSTNNPWDVMITGEAFFVVSNGSQNFFTRDGSFTVDGAGNLVMSSTGYTVMGWQVDPETGDILPDVVTALRVMSEENMTYPPESTTLGYMSGIVDKHDPATSSTAGRVVTLNFFDNLGYSYTAKFSIHNLLNREGEYYVQLDDILDENGDSLVSVYNLSSISEIASFGTSDTIDTTSIYTLLPSAVYTPPTGTATEGTYSMKYQPGDMLTGYSSNALINAANKTTIMNADGSAAMDNDTEVAANSNVIVTGEITLTQKELEASPYNLLFSSETTTDNNGNTTTVEFYEAGGGVRLYPPDHADYDADDWADALKKSFPDLTTCEIKTMNAAGGITMEFSQTFKAAYTGKFNADGKYFEGENITWQEAYGLTEDNGSTYEQLIVAADGRSQITQHFTYTGNRLVYNTDNGKFSYIGSANNDTALLNFQESASSRNGNTVSLTHFTDIDIDFSISSNVNNGGTSTASMTSGDRTTGMGNGRKVGEMTGVEIAQDGKITAYYDNNQSKLLGQIAVANFANASGLSKQGDNLYSATANSGEFDGVGDDITANGDYMTSGVLEMSNVDLSQEFTEMITTQRGFQANSRIITVSDTLLEELVNLKR